MKRNLVRGIILISALALSSCSVNKTASNVKNNDDVYFSNATAGEEPVYATQPKYNQEADEEAYDGEDDYFYYDDYASRINRFSYYSPFGYYDYAYSPYGYNGFGLGYGGYGGLGWGGYGGFGYGGYGGLGYGGYGYGGFGLGFGYGYGGFGYGGFGGWGGYNPYSYWGVGYGGSPYWGVYSAYNGGTARPNRGNGNPGMILGNRVRTGYNGIGYYPGGRSVRNANGVSIGRPGRNGTTINSRPTSRGEGRPQIYQQPNVERSAPAPSNMGGGSRGGGGSSGGGGGGGRPGRP